MARAGLRPNPPQRDPTTGSGSKVMIVHADGSLEANLEDPDPEAEAGAEQTSFGSYFTMLVCDAERGRPRPWDRQSPAHPPPGSRPNPHHALLLGRQLQPLKNTCPTSLAVIHGLSVNPTSLQGSLHAVVSIARSHLRWHSGTRARSHACTSTSDKSLGSSRQPAGWRG